MHKSFGASRCCEGVDLQVRRGEVTAILGPSGSGKSTLLRTINHLEKVDRGLIRVDGELVGYRLKGSKLHELREREILQQRTRIGFVFQNFNLFPHLTVLENVVEAPVSAQGRDRKRSRREARALLDRVGRRRQGCTPTRGSCPAASSSASPSPGRWRCGPAVMLFDEPTSALDPELVGEVLDVIKQLASDGRTLIIVTHEIGFAREVADTVGVHGRRRRSSSRARPPQVLDNPQHERTRAFLSKVL